MTENKDNVTIIDRRLAVEELGRGNTVFIRARGRSMTGIIADNSIVKIMPLSENKEEVVVKQPVFCKINGTLYVHLCTGIRTIDGKKQFQISNNFGRVNGWTNKVYGIAEQYSK